MLISSSSRYSIYKVQWSVLARASALAWTSLFYHSRFSLSRTFFKFFQTFSTDPVVSPPLSRQLRYTITYQTICQSLKQTFLKTISKKFPAHFALTPRGYTPLSTHLDLPPPSLFKQKEPAGNLTISGRSGFSSSAPGSAPCHSCGWFPHRTQQLHLHPLPLHLRLPVFLAVCKK